MKEVILYLFVAAGSLVVLGYSVHMFVGGLVSQETEWWLILSACFIGILAMGYMTLDVIRRRKNKH